MTEEELQAIRERANKATQGPWENAVACVYVGRPALMIADVQQCVNFDDNAEFIANAREDVPKLLDEIERLRDSLSYIQKYVQRVGLEDKPSYEIIAIVHAKVRQALDDVSDDIDNARQQLTRFEQRYGGKYEDTLGTRQVETLTSDEQRDAAEWRFILRALEEEDK